MLIALVIIIAIVLVIKKVNSASSKSAAIHKPEQTRKTNSYAPNFSNKEIADYYTQQTSRTNTENKNKTTIQHAAVASITQSLAAASGISTSTTDEDAIIDVTGESLPLTFDSYAWNLGDKYKKKLELTQEQVKVLNSLIDTSNKFNTIEYCAVAIIRTFFYVIERLSSQFEQENSSFEKELFIVADYEASEYYKFRRNSNNYKNQLEQFKTTVYQCVYKQCENLLRDKLFVGRKTELTWYIHSPNALKEYETRFINRIEPILSSLPADLLGEEDPESEAELNSYNKGRWKQKLEILKSTLTENTVVFYENIVRLGLQNTSNPSIENIFFEASKFIAKHDKVLALKLYVYYVHYDLISDVFDNRQLTKTIQKSLFKSSDELQKFTDLINELINDRKLEKAIQATQTIFEPKRKRIQLDRELIRSVEEQHAETVVLLNEVLSDEEMSLANEEITLQVVYPTVPVMSIYKEQLSLSEVQISTLNTFLKNGYAISQVDFELFSKSHGVFKNSLIEGINDACYEVLDDILIEEDGEQIIINENYYKQLLS